MVLSASRRTDIPAFYADWFLERLKAGTVSTRNPMNRAQVRQILLSPEKIDCIVFWTKDPAPLVPKLAEIDAMGYRYYFQFTLTPYGKDLEPNLRDKDAVLATFKTLSRKTGGRVVWRYDPILLNGEIGIPDHVRQFERLCFALAGCADHVVISFADAYAKLRPGLFREVSEPEMLELAGKIAAVAGLYGFPVKACCEKTDFSQAGVLPSSCIDRAMVEKICGRPVAGKKDPNQRTGCGCLQSVDIGAYNTCPHLCKYCYANRSGPSVAANCRRHDPHGEFLIGEAL